MVDFEKTTGLNEWFNHYAVNQKVIVQEIRATRILANLAVTGDENMEFNYPYCWNNMLFGQHHAMKFPFTELVWFMDCSQQRVFLWPTYMGKQESFVHE